MRTGQMRTPGRYAHCRCGHQVDVSPGRSERVLDLTNEKQETIRTIGRNRSGYRNSGISTIGIRKCAGRIVMELSVMVGALLEGLGLSAWIFVVTLVGSLPLGIVVALARMSKFRPLSLVAQFYISILRGTPLMLQLMAFMFAPYYLFGISMDTDWKYGACAVGFILNYSAYFAEIYRSGLQSIPKGQYEAGSGIGLFRALRLL